MLARALSWEDVRVTIRTPIACMLAAKPTRYCKRSCIATPYVSAAVDPAVDPPGADLLVDYGTHPAYSRADDTGAAITGIRIDICGRSHAEALWLGL